MDSAERLAYSLLSRETWAIEEQALRSLVEFVRLRAAVGPPPNEAALPSARPPSRGGSIGVIPIRGVIRHHPVNDMMSMLFGPSASSDEIGATIRQQTADDSIRAIVLDIDSPGGTVAGNTELTGEILRARSRKPVVAVANALAASAAFRLGAAASVFYASPSAWVGSVGVFTLHMDLSKAAEKEGVTPTYISAGKYKVEGNQFEPLSDEAKAHAQALVDEDYEQLVRDIAKGRGVTEATVRNGYGQGRVLSAKQAKAAGMIDGIYTLEQAIARAASQPVKQETEDAELLIGAAAAAEEPEIEATQEERLREWRAQQWKAQNALASAITGGPSGNSG